MYRRFLATGKPYRTDAFGAMSHYELIDPNAETLRRILSRFVHYWKSMRRGQQRLCLSPSSPFREELTVRGLDKCSYCQLGTHRGLYMSFKRSIRRIMDLAVAEGPDWEEEAEEIAAQELLLFRDSLESHVIAGHTLFDLITTGAA